MTNLTNQQLINILSQRNPDDLVNIYIDYETWSFCSRFAEYKNHVDKLCYNEDADELVINIGYLDY